MYGLSDLFGQVRDGRKFIRKYATQVVVRGLFAGIMARVGSFNALGQRRAGGFIRRKEWVGGEMPSADQTGRIVSSVVADDMRVVNRKLLRKMKRNKAFRKAFECGKGAVVVDGHEICASFLRNCPDCLERMIHKNSGDETQYYHRCVMAMWVWGDWCLTLDMEMQKSGEDEVACAWRCLERVIRDYGRSFNLVLADSLYARAPFFKQCRQRGKDVVAVLKDERREVMKDADALMEQMTPEQWEDRGRVIRCWDVDGFTSWDTMDCPVRVLRTKETKPVRRQKDGKIYMEKSEWYWVTTISKEKLQTKSAVEIGHRRWAVENEGFNELVNEWHADHVFKHDANAITVIWLLLFVAYNLFHAFIRLNLKAAIRAGKSIKYWACQIVADFHIWTSERKPDTS